MARLRIYKEIEHENRVYITVNKTEKYPAYEQLLFFAYRQAIKRKMQVLNVYLDSVILEKFD